MCGDQIPSLPGKKRRQMPGVYLGGGGGYVEASIWLVHNMLTEAKIEDELITPVSVTQWPRPHQRVNRVISN